MENPVKTPLSINLAAPERWASGLLGGFLLFKGLRQRSSLAGLALGGLGVALINRGLKGHCLAYAACGIDRSHPHGARRVVRAAITIRRSPHNVYTFWRNPENLSKLSDAVENVHAIDTTRSHWKIKGPLGSHMEWYGEIIEDHPDEIIAWQSFKDVPFQNAGSVRFEPAGEDATHVKVQFAYRIVPAGTHSPIGFVSEKVLAHHLHGALVKLQKILETTTPV